MTKFEQYMATKLAPHLPTMSTDTQQMFRESFPMIGNSLPAAATQLAATQNTPNFGAWNAQPMSFTPTVRPNVLPTLNGTPMNMLVGNQPTNNNLPVSQMFNRQLPPPGMGPADAMRAIAAQGLLGQAGQRPTNAMFPSALAQLLQGLYR